MNTTDLKIERILKRIAKLKALQENAEKIGSLNEAEQAAAAMRDLLSEYGLTVEMVEGEGEESRSAITHEWFSFADCSMGMGGVALANAIAEWNFCRAAQIGGSRGRQIIIFGAPENIECAKWMIGTFASRFRDMADAAFGKAVREYNGAPLFAPKKLQYRVSFLMGVASGLRRKLNERKRGEQAGEQGLCALVVRNDNAIDDYIRSMYKARLSKPKHYNGDALRKGWEAGLRAELNRPIDREGVPALALAE